MYIGFAGRFQGQTFLIVVDAYLKWIEVIFMTTTTAEVYYRDFSSPMAYRMYWSPTMGPNSQQINSRCALVAPFHPSSNGQVERMVQSTKEALARMGPGDWQTKIDKYLLVQHITPNATTNRSPAKLLISHKLRS